MALRSTLICAVAYIAIGQPTEFTYDCVPYDVFVLDMGTVDDNALSQVLLELERVLKSRVSAETQMHLMTNLDDAWVHVLVDHWETLRAIRNSEQFSLPMNGDQRIPYYEARAPTFTKGLRSVTDFADSGTQVGVKRMLVVMSDYLARKKHNLFRVILPKIDRILGSTHTVEAKQVAIATLNVGHKAYLEVLSENREKLLNLLELLPPPVISIAELMELKALCRNAATVENTRAIGTFLMEIHARYPGRKHDLSRIIGHFTLFIHPLRNFLNVMPTSMSVRKWDSFAVATITKMFGADLASPTGGLQLKMCDAAFPNLLRGLRRPGVRDTVSNMEGSAGAEQLLNTILKPTFRAM